MKSAAIVIAFTFSCAPPTAPSPVGEPVAWNCERLLTHPIRKTYVDRCTHPTTGEVDFRDVKRVER